jgi:preprotein translocase subunit SecG
MNSISVEYCYYTKTENIEPGNSVNVFRMGNSNSSFATKTCAWLFATFLARIISLAVDYTFLHSMDLGLYDI